MRWADLEPEPAIAEALAHATLRPEGGTQNEKRRWSERFANGCAIAVATKFREFSLLHSKRVLPETLEGGTEPLTPLGGGTRKRIDVTVVDPILGLEIGVSLKGLNFRDGNSENYDKNLTGRLYELADEVRLVHEHLPHAFMAAVFFLPLASTEDKTDRSASSFAHTVLKLRERTGRLDPALHAHASRCDISYVALYALDDAASSISRGVIRFLNVENDPPRRGRPLIANTLSLAEAVKEIVVKATDSEGTTWGEAERD